MKNKIKLENLCKIISRSSFWKIYTIIKDILLFSFRQLRAIILSINAMDVVPFDGIPADFSGSSDSDSSDFVIVDKKKLINAREDAGIYNIYEFRPYNLVKLNYENHRPSMKFPVGRSGHRVIASNSNLYSLGGFNPERTDLCLLFQELWCYNFATDKWKLLLDNNLGEVPSELASIALAIHNNILISHGGTGHPFGASCSNDCYIYSTDRPLVTRLKVQGELPRAQYGPAIVIHENYLYTIGGTTGFDYSCDVYRLNLITKVWEEIYICRPERDDPEGRYRHEVVYDGKHVFVLGGGTSTSVYDLQRIPAFNLTTNRWDYFETLPDPSIANGFPNPRKCFSCVQHETTDGIIEAFITGGLQSDRIYFSDIWKINLKSMQWTLIKTAKLPQALYFHSATTSGNGCMYIFGGIEYKKSVMRRRNDLFKMWMTIPKLSEMCWDAITYYNPNLDRYNKSNLMELGIPENFVERLPQHKMPKKCGNSALESTVNYCPTLSKRSRCLSQ